MAVQEQSSCHSTWANKLTNITELLPKKQKIKKTKYTFCLLGIEKWSSSSEFVWPEKLWTYNVQWVSRKKKKSISLSHFQPAHSHWSYHVCGRVREKSTRLCLSPAGKTTHREGKSPALPQDLRCTMTTIHLERDRKWPAADIKSAAYFVQIENGSFSSNWESTSKSC